MHMVVERMIRWMQRAGLGGSNRSGRTGFRGSPQLSQYAPSRGFRDATPMSAVTVNSGRRPIVSGEAAAGFEVSERMKRQQDLFAEPDMQNEYRSHVEPLISHAMTLGANARNQAKADWIAKCAAEEATWKPAGVFEVGDRVVMTGKALYASGQTTGRDVTCVWSATECACDLCQTGRFVAVDQWVHETGWRHIAKAALRHHGQPTVDELSHAETSAQSGHVQRGLDQGWRHYGGGK